MITLNRTFQIARRTLAFSAVLGMGIAMAHAQQAAAPAVTAQPTLKFQLPVNVPAANFSSSAAQNDAADVSVADAKSPFDFLTTAGTQPPPRRTYSRPRYRGGNLNPEWIEQVYVSCWSGIHHAGGQQPDRSAGRPVSGWCSSGPLRSW